jgi:hypothetical protein
VRIERHARRTRPSGVADAHSHREYCAHRDADCRRTDADADSDAGLDCLYGLAPVCQRRFRRPLPLLAAADEFECRHEPSIGFV